MTIWYTTANKPVCPRIEKMRISRRLILASVHVWTSFAGTLEVIEFENQCAIWSYDNHGCTGHSGYFSQLKGEDCSLLDEVKNGTHQGYPVLGVEACGTENKSSVAWVEVEKTGLVTFFNHQGDKSACNLDNGLKLGSRCNASDLGSSPKLSSALATPGSSSSVSELASTTFQTAPSSGCSRA
ncbi:hypothetical protein N7448_011045 [Penicillium atrosanguineum]|nr:hypothetical protein N7448_011045 [Penicillium atrosanguineum]